jgi:hypothetical protein
MADRKISDLTALTAPAAGDYLPIVDISEIAAASKNKRITIEELFRGAPNGTAAAPAIAPESDPNTGIYSPGANQLAISTNGVERLTVDSSGRLGLGTSSPTQILDLESATGARIAFTDTGLRRWSIGTPVGGSTGWSIYDESGANEALRIDVAGNVGIGTSSPLDDLHISSAEPGFILEETDAGTDEKRWRIRAEGSILRFEGVNDAFSATTAWLNVTRTTGARTVDTIAFNTGTTERTRIDSSGRLLVGTSTALANVYVAASAIGPALQIEGNSGSTAALSITRQTGAAANIILQRGVTGTPSADGHAVGQINFNGFDDTNFRNAAQITAVVDGTPGADDMPGRLVMSVTLDGAASPTEAFRITNDRVRAYNQAAPAAVNATATLTVANLKTGIVTSTSAAATDMTLPTGTNTQAGFSGTYDNMTFEWSVINTGPSLVTVLASTAHTLVGSGAVATGTSARFASRRTAANTFVSYRLS